MWMGVQVECEWLWHADFDTAHRWEQEGLSLAIKTQFASEILGGRSTATNLLRKLTKRWVGGGCGTGDKAGDRVRGNAAA